MTTSTVVVTPGGHPRSVWGPRLAAAERLDLADLATRFDLGPGTPRLVLAAAHPDDETIGAGRLASAWSHRLGPVTAVLATAGEACVDHVATRPEHLAALRLREWNAAMDVLGVVGRHVLGVADGAVAEHQGDVTVALETVVADLQTRGDGPVAIAAPWRHDPHPDHQAMGRAAAQVAARCAVPLLAFPVWMTYWTDPDDPSARGVDLLEIDCGSGADAAHAAACARFVSQLSPLAPGLTPVVPPTMLAHHDRQLLLTERTPTSEKGTR
ncbi:MAG: PIG-L deacetylase family protein [Propionibacteriaceae bacterium]